MTQPGDPVVEDIYLVPGIADADTDSWWARYAAVLAGSLSPTALSVLESDCDYIVGRGILGAGRPGNPAWPDGRVRTGLTMGAVQSGKTASMLGVAAMALDAGVQILVVLAGTRVALWRQTYDRLLDQLVQDFPNADLTTRALLTPAPSVVSGGLASTPSDLYLVSSARARWAVRKSEPMVFVVMKHAKHIAALGRVLRENVYPHLDETDGPTHLLVLDDEVDDGSILDAVVEAGLDSSRDAFKQIPRHIVDLWASRTDTHSTVSADLFATYVGYTATPQANFLQADQNPLAPRSFLVALRTPSDVGEVEPRSSSYAEPAGITGYYTGGEVFYRRLVGKGAPTIAHPPSLPIDAAPALLRRAWIEDAVRSYLMAGAVRALRWENLGIPATTPKGSFGSKAAAQAASPPPHTMLLHPSAALQGQFDVAAELLEFGRVLPPDAAREALSDGVRTFDAIHMAALVDEHPDPWVYWLDAFAASATLVHDKFDLGALPSIPPRDAWPAVREALLTLVIPGSRIAVVNSDPDADDRPEFEPQMLDDGTWRAASDLRTIFVSGNVMARGLTLEGLVTTLFLRTSGDPLADTSMQMQRWFGYRGPYLELCRVFAPRSQLSLFGQFHEADEALRGQLLGAMNAHETAPEPTVLEGSSFRATGKIAAVTKVPLCPGATPFISVANDPGQPDPNINLVLQLFSRESAEVSAKGTVRGRILEEPLSLLEAAKLLERLRYQKYAPDVDGPLAERWTSLERQLAAGDGAPLVDAPFFRPPAAAPGASMQVGPSHCPFTLAAYLRLWSACLTRHARGLFATDNGTVPWSALDLKAVFESQPRFWVGLRFGRRPAVDGSSPLAKLPFPVPPMDRAVTDGIVGSTWGSRNPGEGPDAYLGDQLFDYHHHHAHTPPVVDDGPLWRPRGAPGLLLFHVIQADAHPHPVVCLGAALPLGGPDQFAARPM